MSKILDKLDQLEELLHNQDKNSAIFREQLKGINLRLDTLNGSVAKHTLDIEESRKQITKIQIKSASMGAGSAGIIGIILFVLNKLGLMT